MFVSTLTGYSDNTWSQVVIVSVFPFILGIIRWMEWIFRIQLFKSLKLLNVRELKKVNVALCLS
jgi:hypothetical protein